MTHTQDRLALIAVLSAMVAACGGGGDSAPPAAAPAPATTKGTFIDSVVEGIAYDCGSGVAGTTDANGQFDFVVGQNCTFRIGGSTGITLGTLQGAKVVTPMDLVATAPGPTNMTQFLMSLDDDANPNNGIHILPAVQTALAGKTLDFTLSAGNFATAAQTILSGLSPARTLVDATTASSHLNTSLVGRFAGGYTCPFTGTVGGTATISIANGDITGQGTVTGSPTPFGISGMVTSNGTSDFGSGQAGGTATFSGSFTLDPATGLPRGSGQWSDPGLPGSGTWSCTKT
jgi:hypothetical protein